MPSSSSQNSLPSTTSSGGPYCVSLSPHELFRIILDNPSIETLNQTFGGDFTALSYLRHYMFISKGLKQLEDELDRHCQEQKEVFDNMMESSDFRKELRPIVTAYRR